MSLNLDKIGSSVASQVQSQEDDLNTALDNLDVTDAKSMMEFNMKMTRWNLTLQFNAQMTKDIKEGAQSSLRNM